jgi:hypothetical protein
LEKTFGTTIYGYIDGYLLRINQVVYPLMGTAYKIKIVKVRRSANTPAEDLVEVG